MTLAKSTAAGCRDGNPIPNRTLLSLLVTPTHQAVSEQIPVGEEIEYTLTRRETNKTLPCRGSPRTQLVSRGDYPRACVWVCPTWSVSCMRGLRCVGRWPRVHDDGVCTWPRPGFFLTLHRSLYGPMADDLALEVLVGNSTPASRQGAAISPALVKTASCRRDEAIRKQAR